MIRSGQPSSVCLFVLVFAGSACSRPEAWSHDAGNAYDAGAAPNWTFAPPTPDAHATDAGWPPLDGGARSWTETQRLPALDGYSGDERHAALAIHPNGLPCLAFSGAAGLEFACLETIAEADAGNAPGDPSVRWQRELLRAHPDNHWLGSQIALSFGEDSHPIVVARQLPDRSTHLFMRRDDDWHSEEVPLALGGRDPQLFVQGNTVWLSHSSAESQIAPALWLSRRDETAEWTHRSLIQNYDVLPGWFHRSQIQAGELSFCAFEPSAQHISWGRIDLQPQASQDAGPPGVDGGRATELIELSGGPFCAVDDEFLFANGAQAGAIARLDEQGESNRLPRYGPFALVRNAQGLWLLSQQGGFLMVGAPDSQAFALAALNEHDRPVVTAYRNGLIGLVDSSAVDHLELVAWELER